MRMRLIIGRRTWRVHMDIETPSRLAEIRRLNITSRTTFRGGEILLTASFAALPDMVKSVRT
jgi:hypothetical protein